VLHASIEISISLLVHQRSFIVDIKEWANTFPTKSAINVTLKYLGVSVKGFVSIIKSPAWLADERASG